MTADAPAWFRDVARAHRLGALLVSLACLALPAAGGPGLVAALRYERGRIAAGEWWRVLTGHLVHHDPRHLALNLAGLVLLWLLFQGDARPRHWLVVGLASALAVSAGLYWLEPSIAWYVGLSGVLHGFWSAAAWFAARRWPLEALVTGALLAGKLVLERWHGPVSAGIDPSLPVIVAAHLYGAAGGLAAAFVLRPRPASL